MTIIAETDRLLLRLFTRGDAPLVLHLNADPDVVRYTYDRIRDIVHAEEVLEKGILSQYHLYRLGRWAVHLKGTRSFIGWCGLKCRPEKQEVDLGYRFMKPYWGMGYATEAALASLKYGFEKAGLQRVVGRAVPENTASLRVLEKCGMKYIGDDIVDSYLTRTYEARP